jgi:hypothetical protein
MQDIALIDTALIEQDAGYRTVIEQDAGYRLWLVILGS